MHITSYAMAVVAVYLSHGTATEFPGYFGMTDYIIVLAVAIMVFSIASILIFARGKFVEEDGKPADKRAGQTKKDPGSQQEHDDHVDDTVSPVPGEPSDDTQHKT